MSEINKPGDSQGVRTQVWDPGEPQDRMLSEAVSLGMKKVGTSVTIHASVGSRGRVPRPLSVHLFFFIFMQFLAKKIVQSRRLLVEGLILCKFLL